MTAFRILPKPSTVRTNFVANVIGQGWVALMGVAFIPLYIRYLGIEAFGLIGFYGLLQSCFMLLDAGLSPALGREMARYTSGMHSGQSICNLVVSVERVFIAFAALVIAGMWWASPMISERWLHSEAISETVIRQSLMIGGWMFAFRWLAVMYKSAINGLQHQVWVNLCAAFFATLRGAGSVVVLAVISPTVQAFFLYQCIILAAEAVTLSMKMRRVLPVPPDPARFDLKALVSIWRFAAGMATISVLATTLTQTDKILLSKLLPLHEFGHYVLASTVAMTVYLVITPLYIAISPRFVELVTRNDEEIVERIYHESSQALSMFLIPLGLTLSFFAEKILVLWTGDVVLAQQVAPILSVLAIGSTLNGVMHVPYALQLANGWTQFAIVSNAISVVLLAPSIYLSVSRYGPIGAAAIWVVLNAGYIMIGMPFMHRRLLKGQLWIWYQRSLLTPTLAVLLVLWVAHSCFFLSNAAGSVANLLYLLAVVIVSCLSAAAATPFGRCQFRRITSQSGSSSIRRGIH